MRDLTVVFLHLLKTVARLAVLAALIVRKWTYPSKRSGRHGVLAEIQRLVVRMAEENPMWGYARIQGALKNFEHRVGRSTIARILKRHGLPQVPARPTS